MKFILLCALTLVISLSVPSNGKAVRKDWERMADLRIEEMEDLVEGCQRIMDDWDCEGDEEMERSWAECRRDLELNASLLKSFYVIAFGPNLADMLREGEEEEDIAKIVIPGLKEALEFDPDWCWYKV